MPDRSFLGSTFVLGGGGGSVAIVHMGLYTSDISWVRGINIVHETVRIQWSGVA